MAPWAVRKSQKSYTIRNFVVLGQYLLGSFVFYKHSCISHIFFMKVNMTYYFNIAYIQFL